MFWIVTKAAEFFAALKQGAEPRYTIKEHWLEGPNVKHVKSHASWYFQRLSTIDKLPHAIVLHESSTPAGTAINMAMRRTTAFAKGDRAASWHISVEQDGSIVQMAPFNVGCWHAGGGASSPKPPRIPDYEHVSPNLCSVGIERIGMEDDKVIPDKQIQAMKHLIRALATEYPISRRHVVGHKDIDPTRKKDPGPAWKSHEQSVLDSAYSNLQK